ncbi:Uncharacterised protein [Trueperella bialowiezensis]|uniref:Nuclear transport factor 2 family protein n=2 Tax=Trueperella bialowiezensis TaxID=312285 RepID=A0A448PCA1_9ACTO|nr:Uncharacterised protein [Trueperella bialowiezensis]
MAWTALSAFIIGFGIAILQPAATPAEDWESFVIERITARNQAIIDSDWPGLARLTVPDSPARKADEELWAWLEHNDVESITTEVLSVEVLHVQGPELQVVTRQLGARVRGHPEMNEAESICGRWRFDEGALAEIRPCPISTAVGER